MGGSCVTCSKKPGENLMNLYRKLSISIAIASLLLCGNAFAAKPSPVEVVNTPDVFVVNTPLDPVPTQEQREPFQSSSSWDDWAGEDFRNFTRDIPPEMILIAQTVSISATVENGQDVRADVTLQGAIGSARYQIPLTKQGTFNGLDIYVGTTSVTGFATGGGGVIASVVRNSISGNGGKVRFAISGYLVDIQ